MESPLVTPLEAIANLIFPIFFCYMLIFYMVFDCICNGFAELTRFADREFYKDWWNSTTMDEFARNWNKPVHEWLLRHIYLESMQTYKFSKSNATHLTFLFSSFLHEGYMILCFRMFRPWLFALQMAQIPLIILGRDLKGTRLGNLMFWFAILVGVPLISVLYCREYYKSYLVHHNFKNLNHPIF
uniref:Diacylglycerol O-acyltransferase n=1 Tax=Arcella intermedia TaxID=1963864 RepID=A0A6B2LFZ6_9EUKA